jgi:hypothetical protein
MKYTDPRNDIFFEFFMKVAYIQAASFRVVLELH